MILFRLVKKDKDANEELLVEVFAHGKVFKNLLYDREKEKMVSHVFSQSKNMLNYFVLTWLLVMRRHVKMHISW